MTKLVARLEKNTQDAAGSALDQSKPALIHIAGLEKRFATRSGEAVTALSNVNLDIRENEFIP